MCALCDAMQTTMGAASVLAGAPYRRPIERAASPRATVTGRTMRARRKQDAELEFNCKADALLVLMDFLADLRSVRASLLAST